MAKKIKRRSIRGIQIANGRLKKARERKLEKDRKYRSNDRILRKYYEMLIKPILDRKPQDYDRHGWLEEIWATLEHPIKKFKVLKVFNIPVLPIPYYGETFIKREYKSIKNTLAWIRFNKKDSVDIELKTNTKNYYTFNLSMKQWNEVESNFKELV